jgi:uncharacterized repeat protein (TIGR04076 family)
MFNVKVTMIGFLGDEEKYPCHFGYKIGDEIMFDGEKCIGKVCSHIWTVIIPKVYAVMSAGPRYVDPGYYLPFWYAPASIRDPKMEVYDGRGFKCIKETVIEPPHHLADLTPPKAFQYPPADERIVLKDVTAICPDSRTSLVMKIEAFDVSSLGDAIPYYRKQMLILDIVSKKPGIDLDKIRDEFSREQLEEVYPLLAPVMLQGLIEDLNLVGHLEIKERKAFATQKGKKKLGDFKSSLSTEERKALHL